MSKGKHGEYTLSTLDNKVLDIILERGSVPTGEIKKMLGLKVHQIAFSILKLKQLKSDVVTFEKVGRYTIAYKKGDDRIITRYKYESPWPMTKEEKALCSLDRRVHKMWGRV